MRNSTSAQGRDIGTLRRRIYNIDQNFHSVYTLLDKLLLYEGQDLLTEQTVARMNLLLDQWLSETATHLSSARDILGSTMNTTLAPDIPSLPGEHVNRSPISGTASRNVRGTRH